MTPVRRERQLTGLGLPDADRASPGLAATAIFAVIVTFNEFLFALVLTATPRAMTMPRGTATLIGRIDSGLPFGIGDQSSITVPATGLLYLGTNDDNVSDNSGQFQVVISTGR